MWSIVSVYPKTLHGTDPRLQLYLLELSIEIYHVKITMYCNQMRRNVTYLQFLRVHNLVTVRANDFQRQIIHRTQISLQYICNFWLFIIFQLLF